MHILHLVGWNYVTDNVVNVRVGELDKLFSENNVFFVLCTVYNILGRKNDLNGHD